MAEPARSTHHRPNLGPCPDLVRRARNRGSAAATTDRRCPTFDLIQDTFDCLDELARTHATGVHATLLALGGSAPSSPGARLWLTSTGRRLGSLTLGGCAEGRLLREAEALLGTRDARVVSIARGDDGEADLGMGCNGSATVLLEPFDFRGPEQPMALAWATVRDRTAKGEAVALLTTLDARPRRTLVEDAGSGRASAGDGERVGPRAGAPTSARDVERARRMREPVHGYRAALLGSDGGDPCFLEIIPPRPTLIVFGIDAITTTLVRLATVLGFHARVIDVGGLPSREGKWPTGTEVCHVPPSQLATLDVGAAAHAVVALHRYAAEIPVLKLLARSDVAYVGFVASRHRGEAVIRFLADSDVPRSFLRRVRSPAGIHPGAVTPGEIAASILAEILAIGRAGDEPCPTGPSPRGSSETGAAVAGDAAPATAATKARDGGTADGAGAP